MNKKIIVCSSHRVPITLQSCRN